MDPVTVVGLVAALISAGARLTPEIIQEIEAFKDSSDLTPEQIRTIEAAVAGDRKELDELYARYGL